MAENADNTPKPTATETAPEGGESPLRLASQATATSPAHSESQDHSDHAACAFATCMAACKTLHPPTSESLSIPRASRPTMKGESPI